MRAGVQTAVRDDLTGQVLPPLRSEAVRGQPQILG